MSKLALSLDAPPSEHQSARRLFKEHFRLHAAFRRWVTSLLWRLHFAPLRVNRHVEAKMVVEVPLAGLLDCRHASCCLAELTTVCQDRNIVCLSTLVVLFALRVRKGGCCLLESSTFWLLCSLLGHSGAWGEDKLRLVLEVAHEAPLILALLRYLSSSIFRRHRIRW